MGKNIIEIQKQNNNPFLKKLKTNFFTEEDTVFFKDLQLFYKEILNLAQTDSLNKELVQESLAKVKPNKNTDLSLGQFDNLRLSNTDPTCYVNHNLKLAYVPIPKNGSVFGLDYFNKLGFSTKVNWVTTPLPEYKFIVFIRNPLKRWYSGIAQYLDDRMRRDDMEINVGDPIIDFLIINGSIFDEHTIPQAYYIEKLNLNNLIAFDLDIPNFENNLLSFVRANIDSTAMPPKVINETDSPDNQYRKTVHDYYKSIIEVNDFYRQKLEFKLMADRKLLHIIERKHLFYGKNSL